MENTENDKLDVATEATYIKPATNSKKKLVDWILIMLGHPMVSVELTNEQLDVVINNAIEVYTKYAYFPDKYLTYNTKFYKPGIGADLSEWNVLTVRDIAFPRDSILGLTNSDIFFGPQAWFMGNGGYPFFGSRGNFAGSFTTYHNLHEFFDLTKRMTGNMPDWQFYKDTQTLKLMPEPEGAGKNDRWILLTCQCVPPMSELYGNEYVKRLALAYAKMLLGTIRKKFASVQLIGGGQIDTTIGDEGKEELNQLLENIQKDEGMGQGWFIV